MKRIMMLAFILLACLSSAVWTNDALSDVLNARADYVACDIEYADEWLAMREDCAEQEEVPVFDSSEYVENLNDDLVDLREAAEDGSRLEFGLTSAQIGLESLDLLGAILVDATKNKTLAFFSCVREGEVPLKEDRTDCRTDALEKERDASKDYVNNEIKYANDQIESLDEVGADTSGMEAVVEDAEELVGDADAAFDSGEISEIRQLHLRHSRLVLLFRMEKMLSTINYAEPIIEDSSNRNKDEILERGDALRDDIEDFLVQCEYSEEVDDTFEYGQENLECWTDAMDLFQEFNALRILILEGVSL